MSLFKLYSPYEPAGDQPQAIKALIDGLKSGKRFQTLEGVTGSGKTFTIAHVIAEAGMPALIISHNKTLAAQLYAEFKEFFPENAVEYFISYYDYYQPEAYIPQTDTYIEKDASINKRIEAFRLSATNSLLTRPDTIVVASVSCIYNLGSPEDYKMMCLELTDGQKIERYELLSRLVDIQYERDDYETAGGTFRVRGDIIDVFPAYIDRGLRIKLEGDTISGLSFFNILTGKEIEKLDQVLISPAKHFVVPPGRLEKAIESILKELDERLNYFIKNNRLLEAERLKIRTQYDIEMLKEIGYCAGIENYSRHLSGRMAGTPPPTLLDYFPRPFLTVIDESHVTVPQLRGMYNSDRSRKETLVEYGFRLPSALDNRPLCFEEFMERVGQVIFMSATPDKFELEHSGQAVEQVIRPTGLVDPVIEVKPLDGQVDDVIGEIRKRAEKNQRVLVTTLTKRMAEDLASYLSTIGLRVEYIHSEIDAIERVAILQRLRKGEFDCLVGINLLREGLDLPEVSLVAILDADKEGFLRSAKSIIQIAGRAARNVDGTVILYADKLTDAIKEVIEITERRRAKQIAYNIEHGITPKTVEKSTSFEIICSTNAREIEKSIFEVDNKDFDIERAMREIEEEMFEAAKNLEFERAAMLRDELFELKSLYKKVGTKKGKDSPKKIYASINPLKSKKSYKKRRSY